MRVVIAGGTGLLGSALILAAVFRPWRRGIPRGWGALALYGGSLGAMNLTFAESRQEGEWR